MRVLITGAEGQLGRSLMKRFADHDVTGVDRRQVDVTDLAATRALRDQNFDLIIHGAALTDVDGCERDPELAYRVNVEGSRNVALLARHCDAAMLYVSTDYVYDGRKEGPYYEWDAPRPLSVYAASKLEGEWYTSSLLERFYITRTAWLYGPGGRNFPRKILDLSDRHPSLSIVTTEVGHPTYAPHLADAIYRLVQSGAYGRYHLVNEGCVSRYDFARAVLDAAGRGDYPVTPTDHYPRAATPPERVELSTCAAHRIGAALPAWQEGLAAWIDAEGLAP